jgi:hypothetical protein
MQLQATINDDGSPVRVIAQDGRERQVYKVELSDFIIALTSGENADMMEYFPTNNGKLPATLYNFCFARNAARFSCKAVFRFPAGKYLINYCRKDYYVALPELVFFLTISNEEVRRDEAYVFAAKGDTLYHAPLSNVYSEGKICWGSIKLPKCKNLVDVERVCEIFLSANGNSDLSLDVSKRYGNMGNMLAALENVDVFPEEDYKPLYQEIKIDELLKM